MNNPTAIKINDYISCSKGITPDDGTPIYNEIIRSFKEGLPVRLDFGGGWR